MPVVRLSENRLLRLALPVPESAVPLIHLGEPVDVRVSALHRSFPGRVARFSDKVDQSTRTMKTEVDVAKPYAPAWCPECTPKSTLSRSNERTCSQSQWKRWTDQAAPRASFAVAASGAIQIVPVELGIETARQIEIRSGDLKEGDNVVVGPRSGLQDGLKVQPKVIRFAGDSAPKS